MKLDDGIDKEEAREAESLMKLYARYGSLGLQMVAIIILFAWGGHWLDGRFDWSFPYLTLSLSLLGIIGALWYFMREARKPR